MSLVYHGSILLYSALERSEGMTARTSLTPAHGKHYLQMSTNEL
jgi:hypothetical protein